MALLISKSDFPEIVNFTANVEDRVIDFHISDAQLIDLFPRIPQAFYDALFEVPSPSDELYNFRVNFVTPLMVCFAYQRFLLWAGRNITQYGIRVNNEDTSVEVSDKGRAELINEIKSKTNVYLIKFFNELKRVSYKFDGVTYDFGSLCGSENRKPSIKLRAV